MSSSKNQKGAGEKYKGDQYAERDGQPKVDLMKELFHGQMRNFDTVEKTNDTFPRGAVNMLDSRAYTRVSKLRIRWEKIRTMWEKP